MIGILGLIFNTREPPPSPRKLFLGDRLLPADTNYAIEKWFIRNGANNREVTQKDCEGLTYLGYVNLNDVVCHYYTDK